MTVTNYLSCFAGLLFILSTWFVVGWGPTRFLLRGGRHAHAMLLAPTVGCALIATLGHLRQSVFFIPIRPVQDLLILCLVSAVFFVLSARKHSCERTRFRADLILFAIPLVFALCFSYQFSREGLQLFVGSQDQLQYCADSVFMLSHQYTGDSLDQPLGRPDYWLYDSMSHFLPYASWYRRGAELMLAFTMAATGSIAEKSFPILCGSSIVSLLCAIAFVGMNCLRFSTLVTVGLQASLACTFYLNLMHLQGSLANLCSIQFFVCGLAMMNALVFERKERGWIILTGILISTCLNFYSESALVQLGIPILAILATGLCKIPERKQLVMNLLLLAATVCIVGNKRILATITSTFANMNTVSAAVQAHASQFSVYSATISTQLGITSFFDDSSLNLWLNNETNHWTCTMPVLLVVLVLLSLIGLKQRLKDQIGWFSALATLAVVALPLAYSNDSLRFVRCVGYAIPYISIGIYQLAIFTRGSLRIPAIMLALLFFGLNLSSGIRTAHYTVKNTTGSDHILRRLNPDSTDWSAIRKELNVSADKPVLISGFNSTVEPHMIANAIQPCPHFLGRSIRAFWPLYCDTMDFSQEEGRVPRDLIHRFHWTQEFEDFERISEQAIVQRGGDYPEEWGKWFDITLPKRIQYSNGIDILYRHESSLSLVPSGASVSAPAIDEHGPFRILTGLTTLEIQSRGGSKFALEVNVEGGPELLEVCSGNKSFAPDIVTHPVERLSTTTIGYGPIDYAETFALTIRPKGAPVRLRRLDWHILNAK